MECDIQNFITLHTLLIYRGVFFMHRVGDAPLLVMAPFLSAEARRGH